MIAEFKPCTLCGTVNAPPSKSVAHRYLIAAYLSGGECTIENISLSEDIKATIACLKTLGAEITFENHTVRLKPSPPDENTLNCSESGSTLRFLIPIALTKNREITFTGSRKLFERPLNIYEDIAKKNGFLFKKSEQSLTVKGRLKSGVYTIRGDISSQFITGLLFALSVSEGDSLIKITPPFESRSYVLITIAVLKEFGVEAILDGNEIRIKGGQSYTAKNATVEGDYSNAAYIDAFNEAGGSVKIPGLSDTLQGDSVYKSYFSQMNRFCELDISDCPDLGPVLFAVAALKEGALFKGTKRLAIKESDRGAAMEEEMKKFGIDLERSENEILIKKQRLQKPTALLSSHNDHRILMALCVLLSVTGGSISGSEAVNKSFPDYFDIIKGLGARVILKED